MAELKKDFELVADYIERLNDRYIEMLWSFHSFVKLAKLRAPNIVGQEEAKRNVEVLNRYPSLFLVFTETVRHHLLIELAKFFDQEPESLFLGKVFKLIEKKGETLLLEDYLEFHEEKDFTKDGLVEYEIFGKEKVISFRKKIREHREVIERIKKVRNQSLAHDDVKKEDIVVTIEEIESLVKTLESILEDLTANYLNRGTLYSKIFSDVDMEMEAIFSALKS